MLMRIAPAMPPRRLIPPLHTTNTSPTPPRSDWCVRAQNNRAPTTAPTSDQTSIVSMWSLETPRSGPSRSNHQAPNRKPIAIAIPCGEIEKSP